MKSGREVSENPSVLDKNTQFVRKHEAGIFEGKGESANRVTKESSVTLGRHVVSSKSGAEVAKQRKDVVQATRTKREAENFGK